MNRKNKPRAGSLAFYPRVRAKTETPKFSSFPQVETESTQPIAFLGYKAGMLHVMAKSEAKKRKHENQKIAIPCTVLECPPLTVFGVRAYKKTAYGLKTVTEVLSSKLDKYLGRRIKAITRKRKKPKSETSSQKGKVVKEKKTFSELEAIKETINDIRLLVHTNPIKTGIGKKKPEVTEIPLTGTLEEKLVFAKENLGKEIKFSNVFQANQFVDVKAVSTGKGFQGPVKRHGIKIQRPKAKYHRKVGSIGPWSPSVVMWTVPRPGQMGYHNRTEINKRILMIDSNTDKINPIGGFTRYGLIKNEYALITGSVPGPVKRCIGIRFAMRKPDEKRYKVSDIQFVHKTQHLKLSSMSRYPDNEHQEKLSETSQQTKDKSE